MKVVVAGSIRNKILAVLALGIAMVVAGSLYGFAAARKPFPFDAF